MDSLLGPLILFLTVFFVVTQIVMLYLVTRQIMTHPQDKSDNDKLSTESKMRSGQIMHKAMAEANELVAEASQKGLEILAREQMESKNLSAEYAKHLGAVEDTIREHFEKNAIDAENAYNDFIASVGHVVNEHIDKNEKLMAEKAEQMLKEAHESLEKMTKDTEKRVNQEIEHELEASRHEIDEYKLRRIKMIDEHIVNMLEEIIRVALEKKLSLVEQSEFVYKALEEAKDENAFK
jgi:hypothetical protein